ncbi:MAG: apolipoprotein N-acyltransferase [Deltaproteobacteria bacterium]
MITKRDLALCVISALLLPAAFVIPYAGILSWILLVPFFSAIWDKSPKDAFRLGILVGALANAVGMYWIIGTITRFGGFPEAVSFLFHLILSAYTGAYIGIFAYISARLNIFQRRGALCVLLAASIWTSLEFLFPFLFPYGISNTQANYLPAMQIADLFGVYSISFIIVAVNFAVFKCIRLGRSASYPEAAAAAALLALTLGYGFWRIEAVDRWAETSEKIKVGVVQANFDFFEKTPENEEFVSSTHKIMSESIDAPDLVIWPETAIQAWIPLTEKTLASKGAAAVPPIGGAYFIVGGLSYGAIEGEGGRRAQFNTAFLSDSEGAILGRYHKIKLLLFGEYLPFARYFPSLKQLSPATGDFTPGSALEIFEIPAKGLRIAPLICYEDIIPSFAKRFSEKGANLLVNITNDAWFGRTFAAYQHLLVSIPRAIETRLYLVRATNTGVSAVIDPVGRVIAKTEIFERTTLEARVGIMNHGKTIYARIGNAFSWGCLALWVGYWGLRKARK